MATDPYLDLKVEINGQTADREWVHFHLNEARSKHVVGTLTQVHYLGKNSRMSGRSFYPKRSRVSVHWGEFPTQGFHRNFKGYILDHKVGDRKTGGIDGPYVRVRYYLIGTSYPMQKHGSGTFNSWSQAARTIAGRYRLKAVVDQCDPNVVPLVQNESDFKFLVRGAHETGYRFFVDGPRLYFLNPLKTLGDDATGGPYFRQRDIKDIEFHGTENPKDVLREVTGVTDDGDLVYAKDTREPDDEDLADPVIETIHTPANSYAEAQQKLRNEKNRSKMWVKAHVEVFGDARVSPGRVVYLGDPDLPADLQGLWLVDKAEHTIDLSNGEGLENYTVEMNVSKDRGTAIQADYPDSGSSIGDVDTDTEYDASVFEQPEAPWANSDATDADAMDVDGVWQSSYVGTDA